MNKKRIIATSIGVVLSLILMSGCSLTSQTKPNSLKTQQISQQEKNFQIWISQLSDKDRAIRGQAEQSLINAGSAVVPFLAKLLESTSDSIPCWEAVNIMGYIQDPAASPYLLEQSLKADDPHVRWRSIWALSNMPREKIMPPLLKALQDEDKKIRWNAAVVLSNFDQPEGVPILKGGLKSTSTWMQWEAVNALGDVYDQETVPELIALLESLKLKPSGCNCSKCGCDSGNKGVRQEIILSLGKIGDSRAAPALIKALEDSSPDIRWRAAMSLRNMGDATALSALEKCLEAERDQFVINSVNEAIETLNNNHAAPSISQGEVTLQKTEKPTLNTP